VRSRSENALSELPGARSDADDSASAGAFGAADSRGSAAGWRSLGADKEYKPVGTNGEFV